MINSHVLNRQRKIWQKNQMHQSEDILTQKHLSRYRQKIGTEDAWVLARKAMRSLENGNFAHARKLHQQSKSLNQDCYEMWLLSTWFAIHDRDHSSFSQAIQNTLACFNRQEWMLSTHEMMRFYAILLESYRFAGDDNQAELNQLSLAILHSLMPDPKWQKKECLHRRKDLSPLKIRDEVEAALIEIQYKPLYSQGLVEMLQSCLWDAFHGIGREDFLNAQRKQQQQHWLWGVLLLPVFAMFHQFILLFGWFLLWVGWLFYQERRLQKACAIKPKPIFSVSQKDSPNSKGNF